MPRPFSNKALLKKLKSPFCWQICGLLYKMAGNTPESAKCFDQALKYDPTNLQVIRDAANLYLHARDLANHREMRRKLMTAKPGILSHWAGFVFACHLMDDVNVALEGMESLLTVAKEDKTLTPLDWSNINLYKARLLHDANQTENMVNFLESVKNEIVNKLNLNHILAEAYIKLGNYEKAKPCVNYLIEKMPDNAQYVELYVTAFKERSAEENLEELSKSSKNRVISLMLLKEVKDIQKFKALFEEDLRDHCLKFIPSFFRYIKSLLKNEDKAKMIETVLNDNLKHWKEHSTLLVTLSENQAKLIDPTCELFLLYTLSQLELWKGNLEQSLKLCDEAIDHTITFEDAHVLRSKILRKKGMGDQACTEAQRWQALNLGDRCLAKAAVRTLIKQNKNVEADTLFKRYMKDEKNMEKTLHELQKFNHELNLATSYSQELKLQHAIGLLNISCKHFDTFFEDQYDFYSFCLRKFNFIPLFDAIKFNDKDSKTLKNYIRAHQKLLHTFWLNKKFEKHDALRFEKLKSKVSQEDYDKIIEAEKQALQANTIQVSDEIVESIDLHATNLFKQKKVDERANEIATKLSVAPFGKAKKRLAIDSFGVLFDHYINSNSLAPLLIAFEYLLNNDQKSYQNIIRKEQFDSKLDHFRILAQKDKALGDKLQAFLNNYEKLFSDSLKVYSESFWAKDTHFKSLIELLVQQHKQQISEEVAVEKMADYIRSQILPQIKSTTLKVT